MKPLPIGIQSFSEIINKGFLYVDKTQGIANVLRSGKYYFLSRPRRFGKSLLLSTISEIFQGNKNLFEGLWIEDQWDWNQKHPIIHIGFSSLGYKELGLEKAIEICLREIAEKNSISLKKEGLSQLFEELIKKLAKEKQVVILIDEYDKPLIDYLGNDIEQAKAHQKILKSFYSILKDSDPYIQFLLITGVSKFSKVSLFSDLNNLSDITFNRKAVNLLGITEAEIDVYFDEYLMHIAEDLSIERSELHMQVQHWYNGYSWDGKTFVYNPFSLLLLLDSADFRNYWFETGTPSFLIELMKKETFYRLERLKVNESSFAAYDLEHIRLLPLLFQTGYLTIKEKGPYRYVLDYPNKEVRESMYQYMMGDLMHEDPAFTTNTILDLREAFWENDTPYIIELLKSVFARIPYEIFIANREAYYHSLLHITFQFLGNYAEAEVSTNKGRMDAVIHTPTDIYILEFKLDETVDAALKQIHQRGYYEKYMSIGKPIHLLGISFSSKEKSIIDWREEMVT